MARSPVVTPRVSKAKIEANEIPLPRRGRSEPVTASLLGEPKVDSRGKTEMDLSAFREADPNDLIAYAESHGMNANIALAAGINVLAERQARGLDVPSLADVLQDAGIAANADDARLMAMHSRSLMRRFKVQTGDFVGMLEKLAAKAK